MFFLNANTVFNAYIQASEMCGPLVGIGDVETSDIELILSKVRYGEGGIVGKKNVRFNSDTLPSLQWVFAGLSRGVVDIKADIMAQMVREKGFEGFTGHIKAQLCELILEQGFGDLMELVKRDRGGGTTESNAATLGGKDSCV